MRGTELANICEGLLFRAFRQVEVGIVGSSLPSLLPHHVRVLLRSLTL